MKKLLTLFIFGLLALPVVAQKLQKPVLSGMYLQWGYNRDWYTRSDLHFSNGSQYNFTLLNAKAKDKPDFSGFWDTPLDITIPQNSFRIGLYLNKAQTHAIEINFDHAKYVVEDYQTLRLQGTINGERFDVDTLITPYFVHLEHTNGANFYHLNYVGQQELYRNKKRKIASAVYKAGAGIVVPKSDVTIMGQRLDNKFTVAGYIISAEAGVRFYPFRNFFLEATGKGGYANYLNALTVAGGKARHHFGYVEVIGLIGYDIHF